MRIPARVLEILANAVGTPLTIAAASEAAGVAHMADWTLALTHCARRGGLKAAHFRVETFVELRRLATLGTPSVTKIGEHWLIVLGSRNDLLDVLVLDAYGEHEQVMTQGALREWLLAHGVVLPMRWVAVEARMMLASTEHAPTHYVRLLRTIQLERNDIAVGLVFGCAMAATSLAVPIAAQSLVNVVASSAMVQPLLMLGLLLLIALGSVSVLQIMQIVVAERIHRRIWVRCVSTWMRRLSRFSRVSRQRSSNHELANRFFDTCLLQKDVVSLLLDGSSLVLTMGASLLLLAFYHPWLLAFDIVLLFGIVGVVAAGWGASNRAVHESDCKYDMFWWMDEIAGGRLVFADARGRAFADARGELMLRRWLDARKNYFRSLLRQISGGVWLQVIATVGLLCLGGWLVIQRQLTLGQLVAASVLVSTIGAGLSRLGRQLDPIFEAVGVVATFAKTLDEALEEHGDVLLPRVDRPMAVDIRDRSRNETSLVALEPGERLGLIASASHTRLLDLLYGLYGAAERPAIHARLDGLETHVVDHESLRDQVALVRGGEVFWASARENLDLGQRSDDRHLLALLELVDLRERLLGLPQGLDTPLMSDGDGAPLDETEIRRLVLVRALLGEPRLLLIDRGLDGLGLDANQRKRLYDWLFDRRRAWTLIVTTESMYGGELLDRCDRHVEIPNC
ncbi:hypothetical protein ACNOYE_27675 [Nannocystaceae bacterium ST9]